MSLLSHVDTVRVTEDEVRAEPRPEFTSTWRPFSHADIIDAVQKACKDLDLSIVRKEYSIRRNSKMFASWEISAIAGVKANYKEMNFSIGLRNSIDKTHSVGFCAGKRVFVCDNLVFSGDFVIFRKHTGQLELGEIEILAKESLEALIPRFKQLNQWHNRMKKIKLSDEQASLLACAAMRKEILPASKYPQFHALYFDKDTKYTPTLHGFHGACTELMMSNSLLTIQWKNEQLNRFLNFEVPQLVSPRKVARVDFVESERIADLNFAESRKEEKELARATSQKIRKIAVRSLKEQKKKDRTIVISRAMKKRMLKGETIETKSGLKLKAINTSEEIASIWKDTQRALKGKRPKPKGKAPTPTAPPPVARAADKEDEKKRSEVSRIIDDGLAKKAREDLDKQKKSRKKIKQFVLDNGHDENPSYENKLKRCAYCKAILDPDEKSCHNCGEAI